MKLSFRTKSFVGAVAASATSLAVAALMLTAEVRDARRADIQRLLTNEAKVVATLLSPSLGDVDGVLDREADRLGQLVGSRVTLIAEDGRVVGDSSESVTALETLENHGGRPEVVAARHEGVGVSQRFSTTVSTDMLYVAVRTSHPVVRFVRFALPLTELDAELATIRTMTLAALAVAVPVALGFSWLVTAPLARRVQAIVTVAKRYAAGDTSRSRYDYGSDELGEVARALDGSAQELGRRLEELARDRARSEATLSGMVEGVLVVDRQGHVQLVNQAARAMLHVEGEVGGRPYQDIVRHPDIAAQVSAGLRGEGVEGRELSLPRDPERRFVARAAPVAATGGGGAVLVLHDITDLRRADQVRRDFVANVSHELRTPLTAIRGYVEALLDEPPGSDRARGFLEVIARHSARMERLVSDLLRLARLDAKQEPIDRARCDIEATASAVCADLGQAIAAKRQHVAIAVAPEAGEVWADPGKLHDVLRNLIENAVNYAPDEASIQIASHRERESVVITVSDSGTGIPPSDLSRVFERFYRVDKSRAHPGGTGLGLAIVKHLIELHGGTVAAGNRAGGGAIFTLRLPGQGQS